MRMFNKVEKPAQEVFPLEAFQSLAKYFLHHLIAAVPVINSNNQITEATLEAAKQISQEQMQDFVKNLSQSLFDQMQDVKIVLGKTRTDQISIYEVAPYAEEAKFPKLCIPAITLIQPIVFLIPDGRITFDDGYKKGDVYNPSNNIKYNTPLLEDSCGKTDLII
ncbi:Uncharacterised protein [Legionella busanensis]|uniref:Uncharacterized protein n=1 Tax=Legionella busanensis TaxID=190655 RepID=A0A378JGX3_9GAMM|nr:hypothetical protein [Legionella busanensis]STX49948.1 Uncharacterised protein [Legionella busanensis]